MPFADQLKKAAKRLAWLFEVEVAKRIDNLAWTNVPGTDAYYITPAEGEPSRIREIDGVLHAVTEYAEQASLAACESTAGSWFFDSATGRLYIHATEIGAGSGAVSGDPSAGDYYIAAFFWKLYCDGQFPAPNELIFNGKWYDPRLERDSIPDLSMELARFHEGGVRQTWGDIRLTNGDGALDQEIVNYIWENKIFLLKVGSPGDSYAQFVTVSRGRTGSISWNESEITIGIEDPLRAED